MCSEVNALQNFALGLMEWVLRGPGGLVLGYIDPNTMHSIFTFLGPILAFFAAGAGAIVSVVFLFRQRLPGWFKRASRLKLFVVWLVLVPVLTTILVVAYKLILHLTTHRY